jgi:hypothetical protein
VGRARFLAPGFRLIVDPGHESGAESRDFGTSSPAGGAFHPGVIEQYDCVVDTGQPLYSLEPFTNFVSGATYEVDRLLLPLSSDGRLVDMLIVLFHFKTDPSRGL